MYSTMPYAIAQGTVELPYVAVQCVLYSVITYFLIHFQISAGAARWPVRRVGCLKACLANELGHGVSGRYVVTLQLASTLLYSSLFLKSLQSGQVHTPHHCFLYKCRPVFSVCAAKFWWYFLFLFLTLLYYTYYGLMAIVISPSLQARRFAGTPCKPANMQSGNQDRALKHAGCWNDSPVYSQLTTRLCQCEELTWGRLVLVQL
jgi:hypothetical protein